MIWGYLPRKPRLQFWSKSVITGFQHLVEQVEAMSELVWISACCRISVSCAVLSSTCLLLLVWLCSMRSFVVFPYLSLVLWSVLLGVALSCNRRYSPQCRSSGLWASSLLRAPGCDDIVPPYVSSSRDRLDFEWGVLRFESHIWWSALDGRVIFLPRSQLTIDPARWLPLLHLMLLCSRPLL